LEVDARVLAAGKELHRAQPLQRRGARRQATRQGHRHVVGVAELRTPGQVAGDELDIRAGEAVVRVRRGQRGTPVVDAEVRQRLPRAGQGEAEVHRRQAGAREPQRRAATAAVVLHDGGGARDGCQLRARRDADDLARQAVDRAPDAALVGQPRAAERRQRHGVELVVADRLLPAQRHLRQPAVGQVVERESHQVDAADAIGQRDLVDAAPDDGLRAHGQPRVAAAPAGVGFAEVGFPVAVAEGAAALVGGVHAQPAAELPLALRLPQHIGAGAEGAGHVGLGGVRQRAGLEHQPVDAGLEDRLERPRGRTACRAGCRCGLLGVCLGGGLRARRGLRGRIGRQRLDAQHQRQ
jgi:hypothetical protein